MTYEMWSKTLDIQNMPVQDYIVLGQSKYSEKNSPFTRLANLRNNDIWRWALYLSIIVTYLYAPYIYIFNYEEYRREYHPFLVIVTCDVIYFCDYVLSVITYCLKQRLGVDFQHRSLRALIFCFILILPYSYIMDAFYTHQYYYLAVFLRSISCFRIIHLFHYIRCKNSSPGINHWLYFLIEFILVIVITIHTFACIFCVMSGVGKMENKPLPYELCVNIVWFFLLNCANKNVNLTSTTERIIGSTSINAVSIPLTLLSVFAMLWGVCIFTGLYIASLILIFVKNYTRRELLRNQLNEMNQHLKIIEADNVLKSFIFKYYEILWNNKKGVKDCETLTLLPFPLRTEISFDINIYLLRCSLIFKDKSEPFLRTISHLMKHEFYQPGEIIYYQNVIKYKMICVASGVVEILSEEDDESPIASFGMGTCLGEAALILTLPAKSTVRAAVYTELQVLYRDDFNSIIHFYPDIFTNIREEIFDRGDKATYVDLVQEITRVTFNLCVSHDIKLTPIQKLKRSIIPTGTTSYNIAKNVRGNGRIACHTNHFPWIMAPDSSFRLVWEIVICSLAVVISFIYPYYATYVRYFPDEVAQFSHFLDTFYCLDLYIILTTAIVIKKQTIKTFKNILKKRLATVGFYFDLLSVLYVEIFAYLSPDVDHYWSILKLNRLLKIYRVYSLIGRFENKLHPHIIPLKLVKYLSLFILITFWYGCLAYMVTCFKSRCNENGWYFMKIQSDIIKRVSWTDTKYVFEVSMYFALNWITRTIFGDLPIHSTHEHIISWFGVLLGTLLIGYCTAELSATIQYGLKSKTDFYQLYRTITNFVKNRSIKSQTRRRIRNLLKLQWLYDKGKDLKDLSLYYNASRKIQDDVLVYERSNTLSRVPLFQYVDKDFLQMITVGAKTIILPPNEIVCYAGESTRDVYVIQEGYCQLDYGVLRKNPDIRGRYYSFGLANFLVGHSYTMTIRTLTHVKLIQISDDLFETTLAFLPQVAKELKQITSSYNHSELAEAFKDKYSPKITQFQNLGGSIVYVPTVCRQRNEFYGAAYKNGVYCLKFIMPPFCILPHGFFIKIWMVIRVLSSFFTALLTPYHLVQAPYTSDLDYFFLTVDAISYIDLFLMMFVGFYGKYNQLIIHPLKTSAHYLKGPFILDLLFCFPFEYVYKAVFPGHDERHSGYSHTLSPHVFHCVIRSMRILQIYRLPKFYTYLQEYMRPNIYFVQILRFLPGVLVFINISTAILIRMNCVYLSEYDFEMEPLEKYENMVQNQVKDYAMWCRKNSWIDQSNYRNFSRSFDIFLVGFYFSTSILTSCSLGDLSSFLYNSVIWTLFQMIFGVVIFVYVYANIASYQGSYYDLLTQNQENLNELKKYMDREQITKDLKSDIIEYFEYKWRRTRGSEVNVLLKNIHSSLHSDIVLDMYEKILKEVPLFDGVHLSFFRIIGKEIRECYYRRKEIIFHFNDVIDRIYIIFRGKVEVVSHLSEMQAYMGVGGIFGNITPIAKAKITVTITALSNVDVLYLPTEVFYAILKKYPKIKAKIDLTLEKKLDFIIPTSYIDEDADEDDHISTRTVSIKSQTSASSRNKSIISSATLSNDLMGSKTIRRSTVLSSASKSTLGTYSTLQNVRDQLIASFLLLLPYKWFRIAILPEAFIFRILGTLNALLTYLNILIAIHEICFQIVSIPLIIFCMFCDFVFCLKLFLELHTAYENRFGDYVTNNKRILKKYFTDNKYQKIFNIICCIPFWYLLLFAQFSINKFSTIIFYYTVIRLLVILRIYYILDYFNVSSNKLMANKTLLKASWIMMWSYFFIHLFSCLLNLFVCPLTQCLDNSWYYATRKKYEFFKVDLYNKNEMFITCLYFVVDILSTTGTGDIVLSNRYEMAYVTFLMIFSRFSIGWFIGSVTSLLSSYIGSMNIYEESIVELKDYLSNGNLSEHQMEKMWVYVKQLWTRSRGKQIPALLPEIPYTNKCGLLLEIYGAHLKASYLFDNVEIFFVRQLCNCLKPTVFFPGNYIVQTGDSDQSMYFIHRGEVEILTIHSNLTETVHEVLTAGDVFGLMQGLYNSVPHFFSFRAKSIVDIACLRLADWEHLHELFPDIRNAIYRRAKEIYVIV